MKKILSMLGLLSVLVISTQAAQAFEWSNLNPFTWFGNNSCCEKPKCKCNKCDNCKKVSPCEPKCPEAIPCPAAPPAPCDACDTLQNQMQQRNHVNR